jgi:hypothetical protein
MELIHFWEAASSSAAQDDILWNLKAPILSQVNPVDTTPLIGRPLFGALQMDPVWSNL